MKLEIFDRSVDYQETEILFNSIKDKQENIEEKVFVLEHNDVYTAGKSILNREIKSIKSIPVYYAERGGLWTWHGQGQIVVYFIFNLKKHKMIISDFMGVIENVVVKCANDELKKYRKSNNKVNIEVFANQEKKGFWIKNLRNNEISKFGFIGLKVSNGYVYHGISINYSNELEWFNFINPCGLGDVKITSIKDILLNYYNCDCNIQLDINNFKYSIGNMLLEDLEMSNNEKYWK